MIMLTLLKVIKKYIYIFNCSFSHNFIQIPNHREKGFGGGIFLINGKIAKCKFLDNKAFNISQFYQKVKCFSEILY